MKVWTSDLAIETVGTTAMPSPFPGIDPYLEATHLWQGVHKHLIVAIAEALLRIRVVP